MRYVDVNCDMGEMPEALADGSQEKLMRYVSSANVACGGHAGDSRMMRATMEQALRHGVAIGAHPGYEDRANLGRTELQLPSAEISRLVHRQLATLGEIATQCGAIIGHVKAHGALYNQAGRVRLRPRAIAEGVRRWNADVILVGLAGSVMLDEFQAAGFPIAAEAFADRRYETNGSLRPRKFQDSVLHDPEEAAVQAVRIAERCSVVAVDRSIVPLTAQTICIHGDTPSALEIAAAVHRTLTEAGVEIKSLTK
jgi:UPF0271 protein